jgi:hypothetical protein
MGVTTMKTRIVRIISALLVLSVLWVNVPGVRADDGTDYVTEINNYVDQIYQDQKQTDDYINSIYQDATSARDAGSDSTWPNAEPAAPAAVPQPAWPVAAPPVMFQPVAQNAAAFQQMVLQNQARIQQQIMQTRQQILQRSQAIMQASQQQMMRVQ